MSRRVRFTFSPAVVGEPIIYRLGREFGVVTNIRRANLSKDEGWVVLDIEGRDEDVQGALRWAEARGVTIEPVDAEESD